MDTTNQRIPSMDRALEGYDSKFRFVLLASRRAEQILRGAVPKVDLGKQKPCRVGMEELRRGLVEWDYGPAPEPEEAAETEAETAETAAD